MAPRTGGKHSAVLAIEEAIQAQSLPANLITQAGGVVGIAVAHVDGDDIAHLARRANCWVDRMRGTGAGNGDRIVSDELRRRLPFFDLNRADLRAAEQERRDGQLRDRRPIPGDVETRVPREPTETRRLQREGIQNWLNSGS